MANPIDELVKAFEGRLKGFQLSAAYLWGTAPFRPDDDVFTVLGASSDGNRADIRLRQSSGGDVVLSIIDPGRLKSTEDEICVASASSVRWGTAFEVAAEGASYRVFRDGKRGNAFDRNQRPAVRLVAAPR